MFTEQSVVIASFLFASFTSEDIWASLGAEERKETADNNTKCNCLSLLRGFLLFFVCLFGCLSKTKLGKTHMRMQGQSGNRRGGQV